MNSIENFKKVASQEKFKGWKLLGQIVEGAKIPFFGKLINYQLQTGNGIEDYTSIIRGFGWVVVLGITKDSNVITLCQWKPGMNKAGWELPPGGVKDLQPNDSIETIIEKTKVSYLKETGYGNGRFDYLGSVLIESGKYRGPSADSHGLEAHMLIATNLEMVQEARNPNANEIMETILVPLNEFDDVLNSGLFVETSAVACAYKALVALGKLKFQF